MGQSTCKGRRGTSEPVSADKPADHAGKSGRGQPPVLKRCRSTTAKLFQLRCADRCSARCSPAATRGDSKSSVDDDGALRPPVKLVIFDLDETMTLTTFMSEDGEYLEDQHEFTAMVNFESPWIEGSRIEKLQNMMENLQGKIGGQRRGLAVLTRNNHRNGVSAVVNLLKVAKLDDYIDAIWTCPYRKTLPNGAYQEGGEWKFFHPPVDKLPDHKARIIEDIAAHPRAWFPQLEGTDGVPCEVPGLADLTMDNIVLVDDQPANFQDGSHRIMRYAKVTRYDAQYYDLGFIKDMGGLGAREDYDYTLLATFVERPWAFPEVMRCECSELPSAKTDERLPVGLVAFDFDETLTLATFMPDDDTFATDVAWQPSGQNIGCWKEFDLLKYNFESPWIKGRRLKRLQQTLCKLRGGEAGQKRTLVLLTERGGGVIPILNLLKLAHLDHFFAAMWSFPEADKRQNGVYRDAGAWKTFNPPVEKVPETKCDILNHVVNNLTDWLPQLSGKMPSEWEAGLATLTVESIVIVDNQLPVLESEHSDESFRIPRRCRVVQYDEEYRDCGHLNQMGGLGAHTDEDYEELIKFVNAPWEFPSTLEMAKAEVIGGDSIAQRMCTKIPTMRRVSNGCLATETLKPRAPRERGKTVELAKAFYYDDEEEEDEDAD